MDIALSAISTDVRTSVQNGVVCQGGKEGAHLRQGIVEGNQSGCPWADDLGGGDFKKRLNDNMHRSIVLAKAGEFWVFAYPFAKKDQANIDDDELLAFRKHADLYRGKAKADREAELEIGARLTGD
jgi:hypothetical protein